MLKDFKPVWVIVSREVRDQTRDWRIILPIFSLTAFFPWLLNFTATQLSDFVAKYGGPLIGERLVPFLMMMVGFFPITVSLAIALESFVGEKERRSIEPLLASPMEDWQIYLGKLIAALAAPIFASIFGMAVYIVGIGRSIGWHPPALLLVQMLLLTFVQALVMVSGAVVVSSQTTSVRAANLLASFIVVPMALLVEAESVVMFWGEYEVLWLAIIGQVLIAWLLVRMGISFFNREELLGRELDSLNLRWSWRIFRQAFTGQARSVRQWYSREIPETLSRLMLPTVIMTGIIFFALAFGMYEAHHLNFPAQALDLINLRSQVGQEVNFIPLFTVGGIPYIWLHNLRAMLIATVAGIFSFGVLAMLVFMLPMMIIGFFMGLAPQMGVSPLLFFVAYILPHGLFEIPAMILTGAPILRLGATLATPAKGKTIGEVWLVALADWARIFLGLGVPLLLVAAVIEALITPRVILLIFGR